MNLYYPVQVRAMTVEDFDQFVTMPQNAGKILEFIAGELHEVRTNVYASIVASRISLRLSHWVEARDLGHITGSTGGYCVSGDRYAPSAAYVGPGKRVDATHYNLSAPDMAVEVDYPSDENSQRRLRIKVSHYMAAGTTAWLVFPDTRTVEAYMPGEPVSVLNDTDLLSGGDVLPGFKMAVKDIFPPMPAELLVRG